MWNIDIVCQLIPFSPFPFSGGSVSHSRPGALLGERSKQLFPAAVIPVSVHRSLHKHFHLLNWPKLTIHLFTCGILRKVLSDFYRLKPLSKSQTTNSLFRLSFLQTRHYQTPGFSSSSAEHGQFSGSQGVHEPYGVAQAQHSSTYAPGPSVSFASSSQIRGTWRVCVFKWQESHIIFNIRKCAQIHSYLFNNWTSVIIQEFLSPVFLMLVVFYSDVTLKCGVVTLVLSQVRLRFRPCSISPTSRLVTPSTVTSRPSPVSSSCSLSWVFKECLQIISPEYIEVTWKQMLHIMVKMYNRW